MEIFDMSDMALLLDETTLLLAETPCPVSIAESFFIEKMRVRLTFYSPNDDGWGNQVAWPEVENATEGRTAAADPVILPFGTWIDVPGFGKRRIEDTGTAVKSRKASQGREPVVDLYVEDQEKMRHLSIETPDYMDISVLRDSNLQSGWISQSSGGSQP
ncbi:MAG: 3D domain-containing protein [Verrucomicrobiae bacterium]|nr:3D domain-containing protein [Verrucomicrobiae bacterium]